MHRDHLGTILAITNSVGDIVEKRLFDAWGDIVKVQNGAGIALTSLTFTERGYTGHEHLQQFRLINMNGRLYDPRLHRFLQPDNNLQEPYNTQNYNRYGYVLNNPLKYTDPTGEFTWSDFVAGVAIVAGVALVVFSAGTLAQFGGALIISGVNHFIGTSIGYAKTGNWDASSRAVGFSFDYTTKTDFGYGGKKDVSNNNNFVESHPSVKTAGTATGSYSNENQTTTNNSALNNTLSKLRGFVENNETVMQYFILTSGYTRKETLNLLSLKSLSKLVIVGNTSQTAYGSFNAVKKDPGFDPTHIHIRADIVKSLESGTYRDLNGFHKTSFTAASFFVGLTVLHELVHYGRYYNGLPQDYAIGKITNYEAGQIFEKWSFGAIQNPESSILSSIKYGW